MQAFVGKFQGKVKNWWNNPYWAPVTEPLRMIGRAAYAPNINFIKGVRKGLEEPDSYSGESNKPALVRIYKAWDVGCGMAPDFTAKFGGVIGGIAGGIGAGAGLYALGCGAVTIGLGVVAGICMSVVATPFAVMAAMAFGGACIGLVASPYGVAKGAIKAFNHPPLQKTQAAVVQATPALQPAAPEVQATAAKIYQQLCDMPAELQAPVLKSLAEKFALSGSGAAERVMKAIDAMPETERGALVRDIQAKLSTTFETVAANDAEQAITLQHDSPTMPTLRLKTRAAAKT
jgi:hypothetical protein